jgi:hypothetical protein
MDTPETEPQATPETEEQPDKCFIGNCRNAAVYEMEDGRKACDKHYKE